MTTDEFVNSYIRAQVVQAAAQPVVGQE